MWIKIKKSVKLASGILKAKFFRDLKICPVGIFCPVVWITYRCNLSCKMCGQSETVDSSKRELSAEEWYSFIDSINKLKSPILVITGGEPLLRKDIFYIIKYAQESGISVHLCTNGTMLNEDSVEKIRSSQLDSISVSLDGFCSDVHDKIRGFKCFDSIIKGVSLLKDRIPQVKLGINTVITKENFHDIYKMVDFAQELGADQIKFAPVHANLLHKDKDFSSMNNVLFAEKDIPQLLSELDKLIETCKKSKILTSSLLFLEGIKKLYEKNRYRLKCYAGYISCAIDPFGNVSVCDNFKGNQNIKDKSFEKIWYSEEFCSERTNVLMCQEYCWDTTHAELNIRCSFMKIIQQLRQVYKEFKFYKNIC